MENEFNPNNTHDQNVKVAIDKIIGQKTSLKRLKKTQDDQRRILFCRIIDNIIEVEERAIALDEVHRIDMTKYNDTFFNIISDFWGLSFNKQQVNLINFYLYDRYCADGNVLDLVDDDGNVVPLNTPTDLWFLLAKNA